MTPFVPLAILGLVALAAWRLSRCPVVRLLALAMRGWAQRCRERDGRPERPPTYRPQDPFSRPFPPYEPETVRAARHVA